MVNYDWELRYYRGCLIAVSSKCIAYALRGEVVILSNIKYVFYHICKYLKGSTKYNTKRVFLELFGKVATINETKNPKYSVTLSKCQIYLALWCLLEIL